MVWTGSGKMEESMEYPTHPDDMDWSEQYPKYFRPPDPEIQQEVSLPENQRYVEFADIGCGYGGLLDQRRPGNTCTFIETEISWSQISQFSCLLFDFSLDADVQLSPMFPDTLMIGMEIRVKVSDYVKDRIVALREQNEGQYQNVSCIRTNAMKYLPNFFRKGQLSKIFFLFPDPHFKKAKHKWRIISSTLLAEYAYVMRIGGIVYTVTDVKDLHEWMVQHFEEFPLFERISNDDLSEDPVIQKLYDSTEEGQKVTRNSGDKYLAVFKRIEDPLS